MVRRALAVLLFVLCSQCLLSEDYESYFGWRYQSALQLVRKRADDWRRLFMRLGADPDILVPVVFPELLRVSAVRSRLETLGLDTLYVSGGAGAADFSAGRFQMKPSFVEALESTVQELDRVPPSFAAIGSYAATADEQGVRAERLRRLQDESWGLLYLACFSYIEERRFQVSCLSPVDRIRFLAAAYNHGFLKPREEIERAEGLRLFPGGGLPWQGAPFRYADVAVDFYVRYWQGGR